MTFKHVVGNDCFDDTRQRLRREHADLNQMLKAEKIPLESAAANSNRGLFFDDEN